MLAIPDIWNRLSTKPGGRWLFSVLVGRFARYSGSIGARIQQLEPGRCVSTLRDRPRVRNHLRSIHATAMVTFGELTSGLAMMAAMPPGMRAIVTRLEIEYLKKARGMLTAHGKAPIPEAGIEGEYVAVASIRNSEDEEVASITTRWRIGPDSRKNSP